MQLVHELTPGGGLMGLMLLQGWADLLQLAKADAGEAITRTIEWGSRRFTNHGKNGQWLDLVDAARLQSFAANLHYINWVVITL